MVDVDGDLRCNNRRCRRLLESASTARGKVVVTLCSHVFCVPCAQEALGRALVCPACSTPLSRDEEIFVNSLAPSEEWKSLVLAGLRPETVMEVCSRALNLYTYQSSQERAYLETVCTRMDERVRAVEGQQQQQLAQVEAENRALRDKLVGMQKQREQDKQRLHDATEVYQDKTRQLQKLQKMYDALRRRVPLAPLQGMDNDPIAPVPPASALPHQQQQQQQQQPQQRAWLPGLPSERSTGSGQLRRELFASAPAAPPAAPLPLPSRNLSRSPVSRP